MTFWGVEVKPGEPFTLDSEEFGGTLMLTQATLGAGSSPQKSILQVKVGDKDPIFLCSLIPEKSESFLLNLEFDEDESVTFSVVGPTSIHLSGIFQAYEDEDDGDEYDDDSYGDGIEGSESGDSEFESEDDSEDNSVDDDDMLEYPPPNARKSGVVIEEIEDEEKSESEKGEEKQAKKKKNKKENAKVQANTGKDTGKSTDNLKRKADAMDQDQEPKSDATDGDSSKKKKKKDKKKKSKIEKDETAANITPNEAKETKQPKDKQPKIRTFPNGLIIEDVKTGKPNGRTASRGKKVSVNYIGKLKKGGKIFDSNINGKPFKFRLGVGEVIKGWDAGVEGMRVGGKRRLTLPPTMAYGSKGAMPQIPPNAWLIFEVDLLEVA